MAAEVEDIVRYIYRGGDQEVIPQHATHFSVHKSITVIPEGVFRGYTNMVEFRSHSGVKRIKEGAFASCRSLKRAIIPGVEVVEKEAFSDCENVECVECDKLERIGEWAFKNCVALGSINMPSAKTVDENAFSRCRSMKAADFGEEMDRINSCAFFGCRSLESITIPLKICMIERDDVFDGCEGLQEVNLVEGELLDDTIMALHLEDWRNEMKEMKDSINKILLGASLFSNFYDSDDEGDAGKAGAIREWISDVLHKITDYVREHRQVLSEAALILETALPDNFMVNNVLSFVALPSGHDDFEKSERYFRTITIDVDAVSAIAMQLFDRMRSNRQQLNREE